MEYIFIIPGVIFIALMFTKNGRLYMHHCAMCSPYHCDCDEYARKLFKDQS